MTLKFGKMKAILLIGLVSMLFLPVVVSDVHAWYSDSTGWLYSTKLTIDHTKVTSALTDFPVLVHLTSTRINWSHVKDDLSDLRFYDASGALLKHEVESYTTNSEAWIWVKIPSVSSTVDTVFYLHYGNPSASTVEDKVNVWNSNFAMVQHFNDLTTSTTDDSTSNNNDGIKKGANEPLVTTSGKIGNGQSFDGSNDYVKVVKSASLTIGIGFAMSLWAYVSNPSTYVFLGGKRGTAQFYMVRFRLDNYPTGPTEFRAGNLDETISPNPTMLNNVWKLVAFVKDNTTLHAYIDGDLKGTFTNMAGTIANATDFYFGEQNGSDYPLLGFEDEVRFYNQAPTSAWLKADYYSESDSLQTYGQEENLVWTYRIQLTIDHTKVASTLTDFPVLVHLNSSRVTWSRINDDLSDLRFTDTSDTLLKHEVESYTTNSEAWIWVKIPSISSSNDTVFYMYYGNSGASSVEDKANVWNSNFAMVQHMVDNSTSTTIDSTSNNNNGVKTAANEPIQTSSGKIDSAQSFDGSNDYVNVPYSASFDFSTGSFTVSFWIYPKASAWGRLVEKKAVPNYWIVSWRDTRNFDFGGYDGTHNPWAISPLAYDLNSWYFATAVRDVAGGKLRLYVNGYEVINVADTLVDVSGNAPIHIGADLDWNQYSNSNIDEIRICNQAQTPAWIKADYYTGSDSLQTYGSEENHVYPFPVSAALSFSSSAQRLISVLGSMSSVLSFAGSAERFISVSHDLSSALSFLSQVSYFASHYPPSLGGTLTFTSSVQRLISMSKAVSSVLSFLSQVSYFVSYIPGPKTILQTLASTLSFSGSAAVQLAVQRTTSAILSFTSSVNYFLASHSYVLNGMISFVSSIGYTMVSVTHSVLVGAMLSFSSSVNSIVGVLMHSVVASAVLQFISSVVYFVGPHLTPTPPHGGIPVVVQNPPFGWVSDLLGQSWSGLHAFLSPIAADPLMLLGVVSIVAVAVLYLMSLFKKKKAVRLTRRF